MKNLFLMFCLQIATVGLSQQLEKATIVEKKSIDLKKHEVKFGGVKLLAGPVLELTYEFIYSKDFSYGSSILVNFEATSDFNESFSITPFSRFYFQESKEYGAQGFFVEGFLKLAKGKQQPDLFNSNKVDYTSGGLGLCLGKKWINNSGFVFEILAGGARGFGDGVSAPKAYFRGDLNIGYRFN